MKNFPLFLLADSLDARHLCLTILVIINCEFVKKEVLLYQIYFQVSPPFQKYIPKIIVTIGSTVSQDDPLQSPAVNLGVILRF